MDRISGADQEMVNGHEWGPALWQSAYVFAVLALLTEGFRLILVFFIQHAIHKFAQIPEPVSEADNAALLRWLRPMANVNLFLFIEGFVVLLFFPFIQMTL